MQCIQDDDPALYKEAVPQRIWRVQGSSENEQEPLWFGQLKNGELDRSRPVYYLIGDKDSESQVLKVFIGNNTLLIRDYSILESSLGIKLEVKSKEAEQILNQEQEKKQLSSLQKETVFLGYFWGEILIILFILP